MAKNQTIKVPEDLEQCQELIVQMHEQMQGMQAQLDLLLRARFGKKSESIPVGQLRLFADEPEDEEQVPETDVSEESGATGRSHGRRKPAKELPRVRQVYDLAESEQACPACQKTREVIGEEVSEQYDYSPASIRVIEHVRLKRACRACGEHMAIAEKPKEVLEKCLATPSMLAYIATSKLADHLPLNRLEAIFKRDGARIARSTMCDWMAKEADMLEPLSLGMKKRMLSSRVVWTDDTPVKMQDRQDERNMRQARAWVCIGDGGNPFTVFDFTESRKRDGPVEFLKGFEGYLQADAFAGYDCIFSGGKVKEAACWAHARRKFFDAQSSGDKACKEILEMIQRLYRLGKQIKELPIAEKALCRKEKALPIINDLKAILDKQKLIALPKSALGKAVTYALNNWNALKTYTTNGAVDIDNNKSERALRSMAAGRKNWLFMGSKQGGRTNCVIASFIATCKAPDIHPRLYLEDVLTRLAAGETELEELLPDRWQQDKA